MTAPPAGQDLIRATSPLRTPRAAAVAGIVFSVFLITSLVLLEIATPDDPAHPGAWLSNSSGRTTVSIALNLIPFAGIAFLWFIGVIRNRIGDREDRFFATIFLGSGLVFVAMMFAAAAVAGGLIAMSASRHGPPDGDTLSLGRNITQTLLAVYSVRMEAVFALTTVTIARHTKIVPQWLSMAGIGTALVLLIGVNISVWVELLFPAWILALSLDILVADRSRSRGGADAVTDG
jgi:hypothetical protein